VEELLMNLDASICRDLLDELPKISILDPACGSGAFLVSAMNTLTKVYTAITGKIEYLTDNYLTNWLKQAHTEHDSLSYYIKKKIITDNLFGVDIMEEGTEIAKLRLFLALVSSVQTVDQLEPLPNIDFNILPGNSLIGMLQVNENRLAQLNLFQKSYHEVVEEKNRLIRTYKSTAKYTKDLRALRDGIQDQRDKANANLNELLLDDFKRLGVQYEQATWDSNKNTDGRPIKRALTINDIASLHPFHWGYEFDQVMNERGGFDIIITNPPWEILKPQAKEFFETHSKLVSKNKMRIEDFESERANLLQDAEIRSAWLEYQSVFPFQSAYFRKAQQYENQISTVNGKKQGTDINLYKLFTEQCYNLLRKGGECGIVIPSGIYTDLGDKQLREMLFDQTQVTGLFCFENRKLIFENVDSRFKFVVLTYEKGGETQTFHTAFMRHEVKELRSFPKEGALDMSVELIRKLSPDSLSVMEFKNEVDVNIARKMLEFPLLGEKLADTWNLVLANEFHMTNDSWLFRTEPGPGRLPLYEGKIIHQFIHTLRLPRYWVDEIEGRSALLGRKVDIGQKLDYQNYRLGFRDIARNTDMRTLISTIIPPAFHGNKLPTVKKVDENDKPFLTDQEQLFLCAIWNSFTVDWLLRMKVTTTVNFFYIYQLPVPRLTKQDVAFRMIGERAAKLICTSPEFQELWESIMPDTVWSTSIAAIDATDRAKLRAELDGIIAHVYGLNEEEFRYILDTFPLVSHTVKDAALGAFRSFALEPDDLELAELISKGENAWVEFKVAACCNPFTKVKDNAMKDKVVQAVAAFLNKEGGKVLIGVDNNGKVVGLEDDYRAAHSQPGKQNCDGYELFLSETLSADLGKELTAFYKISFHSLEGKDVCCIDVQPSDEPVYVKNNKFFVRNGNGKLDMNVKEAIAYIKRHWGR
jgi:Putative DNA-binding domain